MSFDDFRAVVGNWHSFRHGNRSLSVFDWLIDWSLDWVNDWLIDRSIDWLFVWLVAYMVVRLIDWLIASVCKYRHVYLNKWKRIHLCLECCWLSVRLSPFIVCVCWISPQGLKVFRPLVTVHLAHRSLLLVLCHNYPLCPLPKPHLYRTVFSLHGCRQFSPKNTLPPPLNRSTTTLRGKICALLVLLSFIDRIFFPLRFLCWSPREVVEDEQWDV